MLDSIHATTRNQQRHLPHHTYRTQDNNLSESSETESSSSDLDEESTSAKLASKVHTKHINKLNSINNVSSLASSLDRSIKDHNQQEIKIFTALIDTMISAFLNKNFISASTITEIKKLKPLIKKELQERIDRKFQEMLYFSINQIDKFINGEIDKLYIFDLLKNLHIFIKHTKDFEKQENNISKIVVNLQNIIQNINSFKQHHQKKLNIFISNILIEISILKPEQKFSAINFTEPLQKLFDHFSSLQEDPDNYLSYRASHTCQALIDIYRHIDFNQNKNDSSEIAKHKQSSWYVNLQKIYEIEKIKFNNIDDLLGKLTNPEEKLFLQGAYEILISKSFSTTEKEETQIKIFNLLNEILNKDNSLITNLYFFNNIKLPSEDNFFWKSPLPKTRQRIHLDNWLLKTLPSGQRSSQRKFISNFKNLLSDPIFTAQPDSNHLIKHAQRILIKKIRQEIYQLNKSYKLNIKSSAFRYFRHMKNVDKEIEEEKGFYRYHSKYLHEEPLYRNIASFKYLQENGKSIYFLAYSMGKLGKVTLPQRYLAATNWRGGRGHSEPLLLATHAIGRVKVMGQGERILNFVGIKPEYCATTNRPCSTGETCKKDLILPPTIYAHRYKGPENNHGFQQKLSKHKNKIKEDEFYTSEVESEEECEAFVVDKQYFKSLDLTKVSASRLNPVPVWPFHDYIQQKRPDYYAKYLADASEKEFFASYVSFEESNDEIQPTQENKQIVTPGIKAEDDMEKITAALKNTGLA